MRDIAIHFRARSEPYNLVDRAASSLGKNRSDFMLEAACEKAQAIILDRTFLRLMKLLLNNLHHGFSQSAIDPLVLMLRTRLDKENPSSLN